MKNKLYILFSLVVLMLWGCFDDKGNYDYKDVNDVLSLTFTPEPTVTEYSYDYTYKQPSLDTLVVTYTPSVEQSLVEGEDNLEFQWIMVNRDKLDTIFSKELVLKFPPKQKTSYNPLFRMIDHSTGVEYYQQFKMMTELPFLASWFVLHGEMGDRRLGVVEGINDEGDEPSVTLDAYENIWGARRFQKAIGLVYATTDGTYKDGVAEYEHLTVIQEDSLTYMYSFSLLPSKSVQNMLASVARGSKFLYGVSDEVGAGTVLVSNTGKCFWGRGRGYYFTVKTTTETENYIADKVFITADNGLVLIWDKEHTCFYSLRMPQIPYDVSENHPGDDKYDKENKNRLALLTKEDGSSLFDEGEWDNQEVVFLGQGNNELSASGAMILGKNGNTYTVYQLGKTKTDKGEALTVERYPLSKDLALDQDSQIATSVIYPDQFFFTKGGSALYLYNVVSGEEKLLYDAGGRITKLKFRTARENLNADPLGIIDPNNRLALVVDNGDGTGELHEVYLNIAADVEETHVYKGFGTIQDIAFANIGTFKNI